ncbi:putative 3-hydroxybenzoate 6-hydroxylase 2 [Glarea lozoyensis 74030]|uniref:Putative 3-hydroxybenzoate 6-hydroxylase 2 n=1 Tax=Glarea lozoyensis (strain ATCC 74030 / MF5533) TaxID=1104152 RepID=H0EJ20_GLAL7|nr:putative 3-hydroxybenzoate 6-hydroxylase 2 [Glarea lozoyensis 74030]
MEKSAKIVIAGAAKKGFTSIDVYETASNLGFVGAGIQLAPNMARVLDRLGVWEDIAREAVECRETSIRQPQTLTADVLLAADGIKSNVRSALLKEINADATIVDTQQAAYRIMLKRSEMEHDPELLALIDNEIVTRWIGEKRHIIAYPVSSKTIYNISTAQPDKNFAAAPSATYTTKGSKKAMMDTFSDFCPKIQRMLDLVPEGEVCEWKLRVHAPLPTWIHGSVALVGDSCHPPLPHLAQGAAQAIEDAAVLAEVLDLCPSSNAEDINKSLRVYEKVRKERAETLVELAAENGRDLHLGQGKAKEERDRKFAALKYEKKEGGAVPDKAK